MISKIQSLYLDAIRLIASLYVFIYHIGTEEINGILVFSKASFRETLKLQNLSAHYIVIVFFVLSGCLVTMSASRPGISFKSFFIARLGRLYSVVLPALIISLVVYVVLVYMNAYTTVEIPNNGLLFPRFFMNLTFLSQSFDFFAVPPMNAAFWSISYEFMYYLIIAVVLLIKGCKKYVFIILIAFIVGIKVLLLFPCWLIGSLMFYAIREKLFLKKYFSIVLFFLTSTFIIVIITGYIDMPFEKNPSLRNNYFGVRLFKSNNFISDYLFALLFALNMYVFLGHLKF
jgi:peptidoglycan/LPS O-acetylase OafA/YrhL